MKITRNALSAALCAAFVLLLATTSATGLRSIEIGARRETSYTARRLTFLGAGAQTICEVTINTTINAAIAKTERAQEGHNEMRRANCEGGTLTPLTIRGGWPLLFFSYQGPLPRIGSVRLISEGFAFLIEAFGGLGRCLYKGNAQMTTGPSEEVTEMRMDETVNLPLFRNEGVSCPSEAVIIGTLVGPTIRLRLV